MLRDIHRYPRDLVVSYLARDTSTRTTDEFNATSSGLTKEECLAYFTRAGAPQHLRYNPIHLIAWSIACQLTPVHVDSCYAMARLDQTNPSGHKRWTSGRDVRTNSVSQPCR